MVSWFSWIDDASKREKAIYNKFNVDIEEVYIHLYNHILLTWVFKGHKLSWLDGTLFYLHVKCRDVKGIPHCLGLTFEWKHYHLRLVGVYDGAYHRAYEEGEVTTKYSDHTKIKLGVKMEATK